MEIKELQLKEGIHINEMDTSFLEKQFFVSYNGIQWKVVEPLYLFIQSIQNHETTDEYLNKYKKITGNDLPEEMIKKMTDLFLVKKGLIVGTDDPESGKMARNRKSKYLWGKVPFIKSKYTGFLKPLSYFYCKPVVITCLMFIVGCFIVSTVKLSLTLNSIIDLLSISITDSIKTIVIFIFGALFHEFGHMSYLTRNKIHVGDIGFAFYYTTPVFYSDVSYAWEMPRKKRQILDLGGLYFQSIYLSIVGLVGIITGQSFFSLAFVIGFLGIFNNLNPFLKMDGYWFVSDYLGIPNLHDKIILFWKSFILKNFNVNYDGENIIERIHAKEKRIFIIYAILTTFYMCFFYIGLFVVGYNVGIKIYDDIIKNSILDYGIVEFLKEDFMIIFTAFLIFRTFLILIKNIVKLFFKFMKTVILKAETEN